MGSDRRPFAGDVSTWVVSKIGGRQLVRPSVPVLLGRISGILLIPYILLKSVDTLVWIDRTAPARGFAARQFYAWKPFGDWILFAEILIFGMLPALILLRRGWREKPGWLLSASILACLGVTLNRFVLTVQTLALPTLPFDQFLSYFPSWQETATFLAVMAYGVLIYSLSFRYLTLFPQEKDLPQPAPDHVRERSLMEPAC